jgi:hypothetical protein
MLLDRQRPAIVEPIATARSEDELRRILDRIAVLWIDGMSQKEVARALGMNLTRSIVAGLIARARANGDVRFLPRPRPPRQTRARRLEADREGHRRQRLSAARRVAEVGAPIVTESPLLPAPTPSGPVPFERLQVGQCKYVVNDAERSSGFLFCSQPVEKLGANWCPEHAILVKGGARVGAKFVLKAISNNRG